MKRFAFLATTIMAALPLMLAGCGGGGGGGGGGETVAGTPFTSIQLTSPAPAGSAFSVGVAINGGGLAVGFADDGLDLKAISWQLPASGTSVVGTILEPLAGNEYSAALGTNDDGLVVGESGDGGDANVVAVFWPAGGTTPTALSANGLFAGGASSAADVNGAGEIVGEAVADAAGNTRAVYWSGTGADPLQLPALAGGSFSSAYAIADNGRIVGEAEDGATGQVRAVAWDPDGAGGYQNPVPLDEVPGQVGSFAMNIAGNGRIVGEVEMADGSVQGVVWAADGSVLDNLGDDTSAQAMSSANRIVGYQSALTGSDQAALWNSANLNDNRTIGAAFSQAYDINAGHQAVGVSGTEAVALVPQ
ncbi:MAG: hypothetical protein Kow00100_12160 [Geothermobacteraceae bacterium]